MTDPQMLPKREVAPPSYVQRLQQAGIQFKKPEPKEVFLTNLSDFQKNTGEFELEATRYLYDNPAAGEHEYRVHCHLLGALIADGGSLIIFADCNNLTGLEAEKEFIQKKVDGYIATLYDWHGAAGSHRDEPSAFKQGMQQTDLSNAKTGEL